MCGIAGSLNLTLSTNQLSKALFHRGPDKQASFEEDRIQLHHCRLNILDAIGGQQPMQHEHLVIIFNGEIYNHLDVRDKHDLSCKTNSDTETILQAYLKLGSECLNEFDGMFALAIFDRQKNELFLARDRAGKKPLYYYSKGKDFAFASELNALRDQLPLEVDDNNIQQFLRISYFFSATTPYKNVFELPAGTYARVSASTGEVQLVRWWDIHKFYLANEDIDFEEAMFKVEELLHHSIKRRVKSSDLEVGSFLSGGIDSALVTAIATKYNQSLKTFTVSIEGEYDESGLARLVAQKYNTQHTEIKIRFDHLLDDVEKILYNYGEPFFDSSAIPSFYVSREAKKHLTVILNGDGGDELFGGYRRYVPFAKYDFFNSNFLIKYGAPILHKILPVSNNKLSKYNYLFRLVDFAGKKGIHTYFSSTLDVFEGVEEYLTSTDAVIPCAIKSFNKINNSSLSGLQKILNLDFDQILPSNLLVKMDIATMAHSLEGRSPLLSKELLEYVPTLPDNFKIKGKQTKYLLRKLAAKHIPSELIHQPKRGFEIPLKKWIDNELNDLVASYLLSPNAYSRNFVKKNFIEDIWSRKINIGDEKRAKIIWSMFALEVWYRKAYLKA